MHHRPQYRRSRRITARWSTAVTIVVLALSVGAAPIAFGCDGDAAVAAPSATTGEAAGMRIYVDPSTGELTSPPEAAAPQQRGVGSAATSTSTQGLVEEPAPGGGVMIDLQGRFQNEMHATIGADGALRTDCVELPAPVER